MSFATHTAPCSCSELVAHRGLGRRNFLKLGAAAGLIATLPGTAFAAYGSYDAMLLMCMDPRFPEASLNYMKGRGMLGKYSQFVIAGAAIGVVAPAFKDWHKAFWDNLAATIQLHKIPKVIAINHRECGGAKIAYGDASVASRQAETETHRAVLTEFRKQVKERHPGLGVETGLMELDGKVEMFT